MSEPTPPFVPPQGSSGAPAVPAPQAPAVPAPPAPLQPQGLPEPTGQPYQAASTAPWDAAAVNPVAASLQRPWRASTQGWALAVVALLLGNTLLHGYAAVTNLRLSALIGDDDLDGFVETAESSDSLTTWSVLLIIATAITFLVWLHRVWTSDRSDPTRYTRSTGLAIGGWFIPVAAYVFGPLSVRDLWRGVSSARTVAMGGESAEHRTPGLVIVWWVFWTLSSLVALVSRAQVRAVENAMTSQGLDSFDSFDSFVASLRSALNTEALSSLLVVCAAVAMILIVRRIMALTAR